MIVIECQDITQYLANYGVNTRKAFCDGNYGYYEEDSPPDYTPYGTNALAYPMEYITIDCGTPTDYGVYWDGNGGYYTVVLS